MTNLVSKNLFISGIKAFNEKRFYDAHEYWEEIWNEYNITDALFIQGLIQFAVAYFHITNSNLKGASSMFNKCLPKLKEYLPKQRGLDTEELITATNMGIKCIENIDNPNDFDWRTLPMLNEENIV